MQENIWRLSLPRLESIALPFECSFGQSGPKIGGLAEGMPQDEAFLPCPAACFVCVAFSQAFTPDLAVHSSHNWAQKNHDA
jgi:hypothetical protein